MAGEITLTGSISVFKPGIMSSPVARAMTGIILNMGGNFYVEGTLSIGTSATAFPLASVTAPHYAFILNKDPTNYFTVRNGAGGADLLKFLPGEFGMFPFLDTSTPYGVANTAAVLTEYAIFSI